MNTNAYAGELQLNYNYKKYLLYLFIILELIITTNDLKV